MEVTIFVMLPLTISIYVITGCGNFRTSCDLFVTSLAVGVAGIAGCAAGIGHSVTELGLTVVILIDSAVFSATGLALSLGNTGCLAAGVDSFVKLSAVAAGMEVTIFVMLPLTISIYMVIGRRDFLMTADVGLAIVAVNTGSITDRVTISGFFRGFYRICMGARYLNCYACNSYIYIVKVFVVALIHSKRNYIFARYYILRNCDCQRHQYAYFSTVRISRPVNIFCTLVDIQRQITIFCLPRESLVTNWRN